MKKHKKIFIFLLLFSFIIGLSSCDITLENDDIKVVEEKRNFTNFAPDYDIESNTLTTYFIDDGIIPYMDVVTFFEELNGFFDTDNIYFSFNKFFKQVVLSYSGLGIRLRTIFNFKNDNITLDDAYSLELTKQSSTTDYSRLLRTVDSDSNKGYETVRFECKDFDYNFYYYENKVLIPFSLLNFIFCSVNYYNIYYNGEDFYGDYLIIQNDNNLNIVYKKEFVGLEATKEERLDNYNLMRFIMHYFYGLGAKDKEFEEKYKEEYLSTDPKIYTKAEFEFINQYLNELHSGVIHTPYAIDNDSFDRTGLYGENLLNTRDVTTLLRNNRKNTFGENGPDAVRFYNDLAIITFDGFETGENEFIFDDNGNVKEDAYLYDTFYLFKYAFEKIEEKGNIKSVIFDVSLNGGGNLAALIRTLAFLTNNGINIASSNCLNGRIISSQYKVDIDEDGSYAQNSYENKYDFYVLSSIYTYSSANIFSANCLYNNYATMIGQKSGGGACSIIPIVMPDGLTIQISGPNQMIIIKEEDLENLTPTYIENGVDFSENNKIDYNYFYDDAYLYEFINNIKH